MKAELDLGYGLVLVIAGADVDEIAREAIEAVAEELPYPVEVETTAEAVSRGLKKNGLAGVAWVDPETSKVEHGALHLGEKPDITGPEVTVQGFTDGGWDD